jgi:hypothetical protein
MSISNLTFATLVANKYIHSPHLKNTYKQLGMYILCYSVPNNLIGRPENIFRHPNNIYDILKLIFLGAQIMLFHKKLRFNCSTMSPNLMVFEAEI